jgi:hypothetical protein
MASGTFHKLGNRVINWELIEEIAIESGPRVVFFYVSGRSVNYEGNEALAIIDLVEIFPNILNPDTRQEIKSAMRKIKTDIPESRNPVERGRIRTDIPDPNMR